MSADQHRLIRTSPKGEPFVGRCPKCGRTDLTFKDMVSGVCANPAGESQDEGVIAAIGARTHDQ